MKAISRKRLVSRATLVAAGVILLGLVTAEAKINKGPPQIHNAQWFQHQKCLNDPTLCPSASSGSGRPTRRCPSGFIPVGLGCSRRK
jgi:hypothetical protein